MAFPELYNLASHLTAPEAVNNHIDPTGDTRSELAVSRCDKVAEGLWKRFNGSPPEPVLQAYSFLQDLAAIRVFFLSLLSRCKQLARRKSRLEGEGSLVTETKLVAIAEENRLILLNRYGHQRGIDYAEPFNSIVGKVLGVDERLNVRIIANRIYPKMHIGDGRVLEVDMTSSISGTSKMWFPNVP